MRDFTLKLERQLREAAEEGARGNVLSHSWARLRALAGGPAALLGLCATCAGVVAAVMVISAGSSAERALALPVLARPTSDVSTTDLRAHTVLKRNGAGLQDARAISTPNGNAYVLPAQNADGLCLKVPVTGFGPVGHAESCASNADIEDHGLVVLAPSPAGKSELVAVLPGSGTATLHRSDGSVHGLPIDAGVVAAALADNDSITVRVGAHSDTFRSLATMADRDVCKQAASSVPEAPSSPERSEPPHAPVCQHPWHEWVPPARDPLS